MFGLWRNFYITKELFSGAKLKVKRANQHIQELNAVLTAFLVQADLYRLHVEKDTDKGYNVLQLEMTKSIPEEIPLVIGDAIHNLRAALDLMACEIVVRTGGIPTKYTRFPFNETREKLESAINGGSIKAAGADIIDLILNRIKPYTGGNDVLCALNELDIADKHRLLIPLFSVTQLDGVNAEDDKGNRIINMTLIVGQGGILKAVATTGNLHIKDHGKPSFQVLFDKGQILEGQSVVPTLHQMSQVVSGIIHDFEQICLARGQGPAHDAPPETSSPDSLSSG